MAERTVETSPQVYARTGGALYLILIVLGILAEAFVRDPSAKRSICWRPSSGWSGPRCRRSPS